MSRYGSLIVSSTRAGGAGDEGELVNVNRIAAALAGLVVSSAVIVVAAPAAQASGPCGDNYHTVGFGPRELSVGSTLLGVMDVQFAPGLGAHGRWCFLVTRTRSDIGTALQGAYAATSSGWNVHDRNPDGFSKKYLDSTGGKCVNMSGEAGQASAIIQRCRAGA